MDGLFAFFEKLLNKKGKYVVKSSLSSQPFIIIALIDTQRILADAGDPFESDLIEAFVEYFYLKGEMNVASTSYVLYHGNYSNSFNFWNGTKALINPESSVQDAMFEPINGALWPTVIGPCHLQYDAFVLALNHFHPRQPYWKDQRQMFRNKAR